MTESKKFLITLKKRGKSIINKDIKLLKELAKH
jgi:hypothetical protein